MELWELILIVGTLLASMVAFLWIAIRLGEKKKEPEQKSRQQISHEALNAAIPKAFTEDFREELRTRGREQFEKIISENAMFLQQDLRLTASQLNEFMKQEIIRTLQEEFGKYEQSIADAKKIATDSLEKTREAIEQQRVTLGQQLQADMEREKKNMIARFEKNMAQIINHYVMSSVGDQIDLEDQLEFIISDLEANKKAIVEDITNGA